MSLTVPALSELASFLDLDESALDTYSSNALIQATDLATLALYEVTSIDPTDAFSLRVLRRGICAMAEALLVGKGFRAINAIPFRTETVGSYSYERAIASITAGADTGIMWFDLAIMHLGGSDLDEVDMPTSISIFERDTNATLASTGRPILIGPADKDKFVWRIVH